MFEGLSTVAALTAGVSTRNCLAQARGEVRHENDVVPARYLPKISNAYDPVHFGSSSA